MEKFNQAVGWLMTQSKITKNKALGDLGEEAVAQHLKKKGYRIIARNWHCRFGELDLVVAKTSGIFKQKLEELIFIEVKSGFAGGQIGPEQNIRHHKKQRMQRAINVFVSQNQDKIPPEISLQTMAFVVKFNKQYKLEEISEYLILF